MGRAVERRFLIDVAKWVSCMAFGFMLRSEVEPQCTVRVHTGICTRTIVAMSTRSVLTTSVHDEVGLGLAAVCALHPRPP